MTNDAFPMIPPALVEALATTLLHSLWQCTLIGLVAAVALRGLRHGSPQARYAVACVALAACVLWPAIELLRVLSGPGDASLPMTALAHSDVATTATASADAVDRPGWHAWRDAAADRAPWLVALWAIGAVAMLLRLAGGLRWVARLRRDAQAPADPVWQARLDRLAQRFGLRGVRFAVFEGDGGPVSIGLWRPLVLVPAALLARMPVEAIEALLAHELAHIRRRDYLVNLLQRLAEALLFHHPVVWWLSHRIRIEREQVADDLAATALGEPRRLAHALLALERAAFPPPTLAQAAHGGLLMSRIQSLLRPDRRTAGTTVLPIATLALACIGGLAYAYSRGPAPHSTAAAASARVVAAAPAATPGQRPTADAVASPQGASTRFAMQTASSDVKDRGSRDLDDAYALVAGNRDGLRMTGSTDDVEEIHAARRGIDGDFLWFRRDGKAYVVRDADTLARIRADWAGTDERAARMEALGKRMEAEAQKVEALGAQIEAQAEDLQPTPQTLEAMRKLEALAERQATAAARHAELALEASRAESDQAALARADRALAEQRQRMASLDRDMAELQRLIEIDNARMARERVPMERLQDEIERATRPLEALGQQMETLGKEHEREVRAADREIRREIDRAIERGLASPAPAVR
jgi:beta-lactamase regulating signal transducer with metallopeptidase domain